MDALEVASVRPQAPFTVFQKCLSATKTFGGTGIIQKSEDGLALDRMIVQVRELASGDEELNNWIWLDGAETRTNTIM